MANRNRISKDDAASPQPASFNIEGPLHLPGGRKKKRKKVEKAAPQTLYVSRPVTNTNEIAVWAKSVGFSSIVDDLHVTIAFSRSPVDWDTVGEPDRSVFAVKGGPRSLAFLGDEGDCAVLRFESDLLAQRWRAIKDAGASWDWPDYKPHVTLSLQAGALDVSRIKPYDGPIILGPEVWTPVRDDWKDTVVEKSSVSVEAIVDAIAKIGARHSRSDMSDMQAVHDIAVKQGAQCQSSSDSYKRRAPVVDARVCKVDEELGVVCGWAIVCKVFNPDTGQLEEYYDKNIDLHSGERVPEHIPEGAMLKAAISFMEHSRVGNEMHQADDKGVYVGAFPMTTEIAKAFGIQTDRTGLMVIYKPPPDVLAKFKDKTYTGFSIEGRRLKIEEHE